MKIKYTEKIDKSLENFMENLHNKYEEQKDAKCDYKKWGFYIEEDGKIIGAITGYTCWTEVYIDDLGIDKKYRGKGYGKKLVEKVEEHFKNTKYKNIALSTNEFQAPEFYKKCGYKLEFVRKKKNPKFNKYFFNKWIN
jgi:ribosomal protein S18 acetylase RimI-like enzyme